MAISLSLVTEAHGPNACSAPPQALRPVSEGQTYASLCLKLGSTQPEPSQPSDPILGGVISKPLAVLSESLLDGSPQLLTGVTAQVRKLELMLGLEV